MSFLVDGFGYYGRFGGAYVPEILHKCVDDLTKAYLGVIESESFRRGMVRASTSREKTSIIRAHTR